MRASQLRPAWGPLRPRRGLHPATASSGAYVCRQCRAIQISALPATGTTPVGDAFGPGAADARDPADARFEVIGSPYSLLSVTLSASQKLYTRRGTLVALAGKPENTQSTLSLLSPLKRGPLGIPFLYQRITSTTPTTALVATKSHHTSFSILHLDGTTDWLISRRDALLAWTGHTLTPSPRLRANLPLAHWGATLLTGRGLAALSSPGHVYELRLAEGESFIAHPSHVVAYSLTRAPAPTPFRFRCSGVLGAGIRLQVPNAVSSWFSSLGVVREMKRTQAYALLAGALAALRTALRRTVWGDRLFLQFAGPTTLLMSSRGARIADVLTSREVDEIANAPEGAVQAAVDAAGRGEKVGADKLAAPAVAVPMVNQRASAIHVVTVQRDSGKAVFEDTKDLNAFQ